MSTILNTLSRALGAIFRGFGQSPYFAMFGPFWWPAEVYRDAATRETR